MLKEGWTNHTLGSNLKVLSLLRAAGAFCLQAEECSAFSVPWGNIIFHGFPLSRSDFLETIYPRFGQEEVSTVFLINQRLPRVVEHIRC